MSKKNETSVKVESKIVPFETILRCKLTDDELLKRGTEMAEASAEVATLEDQLASTKKEYQAKIDARQARINELSGTIRAKSESRLVKCERVFNYMAGLVIEARMDTLEDINRREMRDDERQMEMAV
jgi:uncharacterized protein (DUF3084 family)